MTGGLAASGRGLTIGAWSKPTGLAGMLALVLAIEGLVALRADGLAGFGALGARFAASAATGEARGARVLAIGDSTIKFGFDPATFEGAFGRGGPAYNLAVPGTPPMLGEAILRRAFAAGARPEAIFVGYMTLSGEPDVHRSDFAEVFTPFDALRLARSCRDPAIFLGVMTPRMLPSYRYRFALRARAFARLRGEPEGGPTPGVPGPDLAREDRRTWAEHRGAGHRPVDGRYDGRMEPDLERRLFSVHWRVHPVLERSFRRICELAASRGAEVYVVLAPIAPEAQARRDALGLDDLHDRNLRAVLAKVPRAVVLDARCSGYPADAFFDSCHLNARGASRLSLELAKAVARRRTAPPALSPNTPAWVRLPVAADDGSPRIADDASRSDRPR